MTVGPQGPQGNQGVPGINGTIPDSTQFYFLNNSRQLTNPLIKRNIDTDYLAIHGGNTSYTPSLILYSKEYATAGDAGDIIFTVPNAAKSSYNIAARVSGNTNTPNLDMVNNRIVNVGQATVDMDAMPWRPWTTYSATWTFTGTPPATPASTFRYQIIGTTVYFIAQYYSSDNNDGVLTQISMPFTSGASMSRAAIHTDILYNNVYTQKHVFAYVDPSTNYITVYGAPTAAELTDGQFIGFYLQGFIEV